MPNEFNNINFNSIKVRLELPLSLHAYLQQHFNSIKVRLEQSAGKLEIAVVRRLFQFYKGTIRTPTLNGARKVLTDFNSIKVRLEHQLLSRHGNITIISIP